MKSSLKYLGIWQKKREELPVDGDPDAEWLKMQSALDEVMPSANNGAPKRSSVVKGLKLLPKLFISFSAAAMVYVGTQHFIFKKQKQEQKQKVHKSHMVKKGLLTDDSLAFSLDPLSDSLNYNNTLNDTSGNVRQFDAGEAIKGQAVSKNNSALTKLSTGTPVTGNSTNPHSGSQSGSSTNQHYKTTTYGNMGSGNGPSLLNKQRSVKPNMQHYSGYQIGTHTFSDQTIANDNKMVEAQQADTTTSSNNQSNSPGTVPLSNNKSGPSAIITTGNTNDIKKTDVKAAVSKAKSVKEEKKRKNKSNDKPPAKVDWGVLIGANSSGSFTPSKQNKNFYGSAPIDLYLGLFASFKVNDQWAINPQIRFLSPQNIVTTYSHANESKVDSGRSLTITASRKIYFVNVPVYLTYKAAGNINLKLGPVINIPVKQINMMSTLQPATIRSDSNYYANTIRALNATQYEKKINFGISGGASIQYKRFIFEATYSRPLSGYKVTSDLGSYRSNNGTLQFTIGFQLNKPKP